MGNFGALNPGYKLYPVLAAPPDGKRRESIAATK
jgi:hypothetical protein